MNLATEFYQWLITIKIFSIAKLNVNKKHTDLVGSSYVHLALIHGGSSIVKVPGDVPPARVYFLPISSI